MSNVKETPKQIPYLTGYITFEDGTKAKVALWHYKLRKKEDVKEEGKP